MGMEVNWRDMKRISPEGHTIGNFIASLMHFITEIIILALLKSQ
jgi:hypothetical protein